MPDYLYHYISYLAVFRLGVLGAGIICVVLGYFLFRGESGTGSRQGNTSIDASIAGSKFSVKNAAPGTAFALFGAALIVSMIWLNGPELNYKTLTKELAETGGTQPAGGFQLTMRGDGDQRGTGIEGLNANGAKLQHDNRLAEAQKEYEKALRIMSEPMNNLAWLYYLQGDLTKAAPLAEMAVNISPERAEFLSTLGMIRAKSGKVQEAILLLERASTINPKYLNDLNRIRRETTD